MKQARRATNSWAYGVIFFPAFAIFAASAALAQNQSMRFTAMADGLPYYERYLSLPADVRDGMALHYRLVSRSGGPVPHLFIRDNGAVRMVQTDGQGRLVLPNDLALVRRAEIGTDGGRGAVQLQMDAVPIIPLARTIPMRAIDNALSDFEAARRSAGPAALVIPRLRAIYFPDVSAGSVIFADGHRLALPLDGEGHVIVRPNARNMAGAVRIELANVPSRAAYGEN